MKQLFVASSLQQGKILLCPMDLNFDPENWDCTDDGTVSHMRHVLAKFYQTVDKQGETFSDFYSKYVQLGLSSCQQLSANGSTGDDTTQLDECSLPCIRAGRSKGDNLQGQWRHDSIHMLSWLHFNLMLKVQLRTSANAEHINAYQ